MKKFSAILRFFTQFGFIVFTYLTNSGNTKSNISDREQVISALQLIWEDLVRALISERILRDNKRLLANNQDLVVNNLANLQPLQVSSQASEYAQLPNQSLQIALEDVLKVVSRNFHHIVTPLYP